MQFDDKDQFKKISESEKKELFSEMILFPEDILCKTMDDLFTIRPLKWLKENRLQFDSASKGKDIKSGSEALCQLLHKKQHLYIFKGTFIRDKFSIFLELISDIYKIQRRDNFRTRFPDSISTKVFLKYNNHSYVGKVFDLSKGGVRIECNDPIESLQVNDMVNLEIHYLVSIRLEAKANLRHRNSEIIVVNNKPMTKHYFGFEFKELSAESENQLTSINMELYRNFFSKLG